MLSNIIEQGPVNRNKGIQGLSKNRKYRIIRILIQEKRKYQINVSFALLLNYESCTVGHSEFSLNLLPLLCDKVKPVPEK